MITLFALSAVIGVIMLFFENAAKYSSPAPSMYQTSGYGWIFITIGIIGYVCVSFLP